MSPHLFARQTPQPLSAPLAQPSTTLALSTTFTPPASCLLPSQITILPSPGYLIWHNEPVPHPNSTQSACYPSQFLASYTSIAPTTSLALGSSVVPALSPLACPVGYCTAYVGAGNYLACCPRGYQFASTGAAGAGAVASRPAYGGVCYSDIARGQEMTAVVYDALGSAREELWKPSTTGAQAWAHPIDGWAAGRPSVACAAIETSSSASSSASGTSRSAAAGDATTRPLASAQAKAKKKKAGGGVIAGAVLGALVGLAAILGVVLLLLRRKRQGKAVEEKSPKGDDGALYQLDGSEVHQKDGNGPGVEVHAVAAPIEMGAATAQTELDSRNRAITHELRTERVAELPAGSDGRTGRRENS